MNFRQSFPVGSINGKLHGVPAVWWAYVPKESYNRWRTIYRGVKEQYKDYQWSTKIGEGVYNLYPLFDWKTEDIWIANGKFPMGLQ